MNRNFPMTLTFAGAMILLAASARMGWMDRGAVETLLLVLPIIAITRLARCRSSCGCTATDGRA